MTYRDYLTRYYSAALNAGLSYESADAIRRDAQRLHTWSERECNGDLQRMEEDGTFLSLRGKERPLKAGKVYAAWNINGPGPIQYTATSDRETPAIARIAKAAASIGATVELQGDPRGWPVSIKLADGRELSPPIRC